VKAGEKRQIQGGWWKRPVRTAFRATVMGTEKEGEDQKAAMSDWATRQRIWKEK